MNFIGKKSMKTWKNQNMPTNIRLKRVLERKHARCALLCAQNKKNVHCCVRHPFFDNDPSYRT